MTTKSVLQRMLTGILHTAKKKRKIISSQENGKELTLWEEGIDKWGLGKK